MCRLPKQPPPPPPHFKFDVWAPATPYFQILDLPFGGGGGKK